MRQVQSIIVAPDEGEVRLDRWFRRHFPTLGHAHIEKMIRTGQVRVDGARAKANDRIGPGQTIRVPPLPEAAPAPPAARLRNADADYIRSLVLYRDADAIVLNKPAGLAVQGGVKTPRHVDGLLDGLKFDREERPKLVHRLDRDTSGCLVLARNAGSAAELSARFRARDTDKIYWAIVLGSPRPARGEIRGWMRKAPGREGETMQRCLQQDDGAVHAITQYEVLSDAGGRAAWVALKPVTGRTHQLRFHMAEIGCAIVGDKKYTCDRPTPGGLEPMLHLHARAIRITRPRGGMLKAEAPLPPHMEAAFERLGFRAGDAKNPFAPFEAQR